MNRYFLASAVAIVVLVVGVMWWTHAERYYPLLHVAFPDRSELVFVDVPWTSESKCLAANRKMMDAIGKSCSLCKMDQHCDKQIEPEWQRALAGLPVTDYVVHSGTQRIVVKAGNASQQSCVAMAEQIARAKKQPARCVPAQ